MIRRLSTEYLKENRKEILRLILKGLEAHPPVTEKPESIYKLCLSNHIQVWAILDKTTKGICLTSHEGKVLSVYGFTGRDVLRHLPDLVEILKIYAKRYGLQYVQSLTIPPVAEKILKRPYQSMALVTIDLSKE